jgi:hypothetical protein
MGYWKKLFSWGLSYCAMSCALSAITLPLLCMAGIPLPLLAPVATLIATPLVTLILASSVLLFILEITGIGGGRLLIACVEFLAAVWHLFLDQAPSGYAIPFPAVSSLISIPLIALTALTLYLVRQHHPVTRIICSVTSMIVLYCIGYGSMAPEKTILLVRSGAIQLIRTPTSTTIIDRGRSSVKDPLRWADYTVARALTAEGRRNADLLLITRATAGSLNRAKILIEKKLIAAVIINDPGTDEKAVAQFSETYSHHIPCIINERPNR